MDALAGDCQVYLFEGERKDVQARVNEFLRTQKDNETTRLVDVVYNYQGPEYDGRAPIPDSATCGVGLVFNYGLPPLTALPPVRETHGFVPPANNAAPCPVTPEMLFTVLQAANPPQEPTTRFGRAWQRFARRFL